MEPQDGVMCTLVCSQSVRSSGGLDSWLLLEVGTVLGLSPHPDTVSEWTVLEWNCSRGCLDASTAE
jgi:hypothetical protein